jgi:DNA-binding MarR family transcriptional regulator
MFFGRYRATASVTKDAIFLFRTKCACVWYGLSILWNFRQFAELALREGREMSDMLDRPEWDLRLGYLIHDVSRLRRMMFDRALAPLGITRSQWWVLAFISRKDGLPQTQLANELDVGKVAVGALIDRLESSGFVIRQADPVDRRIKRVYVTKQARGFLSRIRKETDKFNAQIVRGIDRRQLETTSDSLLAMKRNLLALSDGTIPAENSETEDVEKKLKPRKRKAAA